MVVNPKIIEERIIGFLILSFILKPLMHNKLRAKNIVNFLNIKDKNVEKMMIMQKCMI